MSAFAPSNERPMAFRKGWGQKEVTERKREGAQGWFGRPEGVPVRAQQGRGQDPQMPVRGLQSRDS